MQETCSSGEEIIQVLANDKETSLQKGRRNEAYKKFLL